MPKSRPLALLREGRPGGAVGLCDLKNIVRYSRITQWGSFMSHGPELDDVQQRSAENVSKSKKFDWLESTIGSIRTSAFTPSSVNSTCEPSSWTPFNQPYRVQFSWLMPSVLKCTTRISLSSGLHTSSEQG